MRKIVILCTLFTIIIIFGILNTKENVLASSPGIIFSGNTDPDFGAGSASINNWVVGTTSFPEIFTPSVPNVIKTSYGYISAFAQKNGITPNDLSSGPGNRRCMGGISNCRLVPGFQNGLYIANGDLVFDGQEGTGGPYTFQANSDYVILVNGTLIIKKNIRVPVGSTVTFAVSGHIRVDPAVGSAPSSTIPNIEGYYSTDASFIIQGAATCPSTPDLRLNVGGSIVVNAALTGGALTNTRDLCGANDNYPALYIEGRPDFILNAPQLIRSTQTVWQEVAP